MGGGWGGVGGEIREFGCEIAHGWVDTFALVLTVSAYEGELGEVSLSGGLPGLEGSNISLSFDQTDESDVKRLSV